MGINLLGDGVRDALDPRLAKGTLQRSSPVTQVLRTGQPAPVDTQSTLDVAGLSTEFRVDKNPLRAVRDVSFSLNGGECLAIVGESGSGKSVTALSITGQLHVKDAVAAANGVAVITSGTVAVKNSGVPGPETFSASEPFLRRGLAGTRHSLLAYFSGQLRWMDPLICSPAASISTRCFEACDRVAVMYFDAHGRGNGPRSASAQLLQAHGPLRISLLEMDGILDGLLPRPGDRQSAPSVQQGRHSFVQRVLRKGDHCAHNLLTRSQRCGKRLRMAIAP